MELQHHIPELEGEYEECLAWTTRRWKNPATSWQHHFITSISTRHSLLQWSTLMEKTIQHLFG